MSILSDFADWWKARRVPIKEWYRDGAGRWAFRVDVDGQAFVCAARTSPTRDGRTSVMKRVAGRAQTRDALIALRLRDATYVFDPVAVLAHGQPDDPNEDSRKRRGEEWVSIPVSLACDFDEWYDGTAEPVAYGDVEAA